MPNNTLIDGDFTTAQAVSPPLFSQPFDGDNGEYILEQDFWVHQKNYIPLPLNTPHNDGVQSFPDHVLVKESALSKVGNGIVQFTRTYAKIPASRNDYSSIAYTFIGFLGGLIPTTYVGNPTIPPGRPPFTKVVTCRIQNDYFLVAIQTPPAPATTTPPPEPSGTVNNLLASPFDIPIIPKQAYYQGPGYWAGSGPYTWTPLYSDPVQEQTHGLKLDYIWDITGNLGISGIGFAPVPSRTQYDLWISAGTEIVAEDSVVTRWMGNIYQRQTKYVVAI